MKRIINKMICFVTAFLLIGSLFVVDSQAAGGLSISASSSKVSVGDTFTVTVKAASDYFVAGISLSVSGGTIVSDIGKTSLDSGESTTAKIKLTGDSCTVSVSGTAANYTTETEGSASASVTVQKKVETSNNSNSSNNNNNSNNNSSNNNSNNNSSNSNNSNNNTTAEPAKSSDNNLSSITLSEGTLSPVFSAGTTSYKVELPSTATKITLSAKANDAKATVSGTGEKTLNAGDNIFDIVCKAENGSTKKYTVNVYVDETPLVYATYNEKQLGVVRNLTNIGIPATFEATTVTLEEQEVAAYHSNQYNLTILYLVNETGEKNFYIYEAEKGVTSLFRPVALLGRNVVLYDLTEEEQVRENMIYQEMTIDGITLNGWVYEGTGYENYAQIPVMNEFGEKVIYQYEKTENSLQLYKEYVEPLEEAEEEIPEVKTVDMTWFLIAAGAAGVFLITTIVAVVKNSKLKKSKTEN